MSNKIALHITLPFKESRLRYLNCILSNCIGYPLKTDIYVHTNVAKFPTDKLDRYSNGHIIIIHNGPEPEYLSWKCRPIIDSQKDKYDYTMYSDVDVVIPPQAVVYYLTYRQICNTQGYNLGFVRVYNDKGQLYNKDFPDKIAKEHVIIEHERFVKNTFVQCGMWIYDKETMIRWAQTDDFNPKKIMKRKYKKGTRIEKQVPEKSSLGLHFPGSKWYKDTIIPTKMNGNLLHPDCKVYTFNGNDNRIPFHKCIL